MVNPPTCGYPLYCDYPSAGCLTTRWAVAIPFRLFIRAKPFENSMKNQVILRMEHGYQPIGGRLHTTLADGGWLIDNIPPMMEN